MLRIAWFYSNAFVLQEELRNPEMRKWAWQIYVDSSSEKSKVRNSIDHNEPQIIANLNKRIDRIERKKLQFNDEYNNTCVNFFDEQAVTSIDELSTRIRSQLKHIRLSVPSLSVTMKPLSRKSLVENLFKMETICEVDAKETAKDKAKSLRKMRQDLFAEKKLFDNETDKKVQKVNPLLKSQPVENLRKSRSDSNLDRLDAIEPKSSVKYSSICK
jgi:hypothetical protein